MARHAMVLRPEITLEYLHAWSQTIVDENFNVYVTIEIAALSVLIAGNGVGRAVSDRHQDSSHGDVFDLEKISCYSSRPLFAELLILCRAELVVRGVPGNFDQVAVERFRDIGQIRQIVLGGLTQDR
jgi:hypothetical protein